MFTIEMVNSAVEAITKSQAKAHLEIGKVILMSVYFINEKGDAGAANALIKCLRKSTKLDAIIALIEAKSNVGYISGSFKMVKLENPNVWPTDAEDMKALRAECRDWESYRKPAKVEAFDVEEKLAAIISGVSKAHKGNREVLHAELVQGITMLLAKFHSAAFDGEIIECAAKLVSQE